MPRKRQLGGYTVESLPEGLLRQAKEDGFSDRYLSILLHCDETTVADKRLKAGIVGALGQAYTSAELPVKATIIPPIILFRSRSISLTTLKR